MIPGDEGWGMGDWGDEAAVRTVRSGIRGRSARPIVEARMFAQAGLRASGRAKRLARALAGLATSCAADGGSRPGGALARLWLPEAANDIDLGLGVAQGQ